MYAHICVFSSFITTEVSARYFCMWLFREWIKVSFMSLHHQFYEHFVTAQRLHFPALLVWQKSDQCDVNGNGCALERTRVPLLPLTSSYWLEWGYGGRWWSSHLYTAPGNRSHLQMREKNRLKGSFRATSVLDYLCLHC